MPRRSLWRVVRDLNAEGRLALFVGAGISIGCGLPGWKDLVERVLQMVWKSQPELLELLLSNRSILAARYARQKLGKNFNRMVHDCLYRDDVQISPCVSAIAKSGIRQICTFNFDDLLEEALLSETVDSVIATPNEAFEVRHDRVTIYHPHGILPRFDRDAELDSARIVFSEDDYHNLYSDPYSWANVAQLTLLTGHSVLFVGLSMQDPNLRRLIDIARSRGFKNQHFAVFRDPTKGCKKEEVTRQSRVRQLIEIDMKSLGVTPWFTDSHEKLAEIFHAIRIRLTTGEPENAP